MSPLDLRFQSFGLWLVQGKAPGKPWTDGLPFWLCHCACGTQAAIYEAALVEGRTRSCGCDYRDARGQRVRFIDMTGWRCGKRLAQGRVVSALGKKNILWLCQCRCGSVNEVQGGALRRGTKLLCNHCEDTSRHRVKAGRWYGELWPIERGEDTKHGAMRWWCECRGCGQNVLVLANDLASGRTRSCGCTRGHNDPPMIGRIAGLLRIIKLGEPGRRGKKQYLCECTCPEKTRVIVAAANLKNGKVRSCGCLKRELSRERMASRNRARALGPTPFDFWQQFATSQPSADLALLEPVFT